MSSFQRTMFLHLSCTNRFLLLSFLFTFQKVVAEDSENDGRKDQDRGWAVYLFYVVGGILISLTLVFLSSVAWKMMRNPEQFGVNVNGEQGAARVRTVAVGLTKAMLDTFPVIKFRKDEEGMIRDEEQMVEGGKKKDDIVDVELTDVKTNPMELESVLQSQVPTSSSEPNPASVENPENQKKKDVSNDEKEEEKEEDKGKAKQSDSDDQICPICVQPFLESDDLRLLPCDRRHRFHTDCIDPWLLNISPNCPLCRSDLSKGNAPNENEEDPNAEGSTVGTEGQEGIEGEHGHTPDTNLDANVNTAANISGYSGGKHHQFSNTVVAKYIKGIRDRRKRKTVIAGEVESTSNSAASGTS